MGKNEKRNTDAAPVMPFKVDHKLSVNIATQVTDGIRNAIISGTTPLPIDPIDLLLHNPIRDVDAISDAILAYLQTGKPAEDITLVAVFVADKSPRN